MRGSGKDSGESSKALGIEEPESQICMHRGRHNCRKPPRRRGTEGALSAALPAPVTFASGDGSNEGAGGGLETLQELCTTSVSESVSVSVSVHACVFAVSVSDICI